MKRGTLKRSEAGFTLIEMMIVVAILGLLIVNTFPTILDLHRLAESEAALQTAQKCLESQTEILRAAPYDLIAGGPFDPQVSDLAKIPEGKGEFAVDPNRDGGKLIDIRVSWMDPRIGPRSIHTVIYRFPD